MDRGLRAEIHLNHLSLVQEHLTPEAAQVLVQSDALFVEVQVRM